MCTPSFKLLLLCYGWYVALLVMFTELVSQVYGALRDSFTTYPSLSHSLSV